MSMEHPLQEIETANKFLHQHPLTLQELLKWEVENLQKLQERVRSITEDAGDTIEDLQMMEADVKDMVIGAFAMSPRFMFEFFDSKAMVVEIRHRDGGFYFVVAGKENDKNHISRLDCERAAFMEAVKMHEEKLAD